MKKTINSFHYLLMIIVGILAFSCDAPAPVADICVSIPPQAYLVERIAGDDVRVSVMIPPGSAPPTYAPTASQIRDLHQCRLYIKIGHPDFHFELNHIDPFLKKNPHILTVNMADSLDIIPGDSHIWLSPAFMRTAAGRIHRQLSRMYPERKDSLDANYRALVRDIDELDRELREIFRDHQGARFLTLHPSWGYFSRDYGIRQLSIRHEHKSPSTHHLMEIIEEAKEANINVIFVQKEFSSEQVDVLSREIGAKVEALDPLNRSWLENIRNTGRVFLQVFNER